MPFLVPALVSGLSDVLILVLQEHREEAYLWIHQLLDSGTSNNSSGGVGETILVEDDDTTDSSFLSVHHVQYLAFAAVLRLLLLLFPLPYHSYTGTAIRFPTCYQLFYAITLAIVLIHMLALSMIDPDSIATMIPSGATTSASTTDSTTIIDNNDDNNIDVPSLATLQLHLSRSCWWILLLSLLSVLNHIVMLIHVRSTAPSMEYIPYHSLGNRKKKLVYYYASRRSMNFYDTVMQDENNNDNNPDGGLLPSNFNLTTPMKKNNNNKQRTNSTSIDLEQQQVQESKHSGGGVDPLVLSSPNGTDMDVVPDFPPTSPMQKLSSQYDDFVSEMQTRISHLKKDWTHKLDDFTQRHLNIITAGTNNATNRIIGNHQHNNPLLPLTPFRVLLQLFAYQDVIDSGKLDAVFDMDQGQSMTFFVPQLLSFLLHGAYYESDPTKLEAWILDKCTKHVHFAHRCYWFLKAWSLEQTYEQQQQQPTAGSAAATPPHSTNSLLLSNSSKSNGAILLSHSNSQSSLTPAPVATSSTTNRSRNNSFSSLAAISTNGSSQKLLPEERAVVEDLMLRVVQCGEASARILHYGLPQQQNNDNDTVGTPTRKNKGRRRGKRDKTGTTPKKQLFKNNNKTGTPKKLFNNNNNNNIVFAGENDVEKSFEFNQTTSNAITGEHQQPSNGLFWDDHDHHEEDNIIDKTGSGGDDHHKKSPSSYTYVPELVLTPDMEANLPMDPNTGFPSHRHLETLTASQRFGFMPWASAKRQHELTLRSMMTTATTSNSPPSSGGSLFSPTTTDSFQATPRFLDALLAIADGLFLVPRDQRKKQLRLQLQALEVELLPSNAIYVPISDVHHRVWRVVADESIALNTKERVPCIILLEVVDYNQSETNPTIATNSKDSESVGESDDGELVESWDVRRSKEKRTLELPKLELPKLGLPKKSTRTISTGSRTLGSRESRELETAATNPTPFALPYYTMMGGVTEKELVNHWRYARRDPHRGESILDKMTSSLPLEMNRMKERIHQQLRGKQGAIFQDLLAMTNPDDHDIKSSGKHSSTRSAMDKTTTTTTKEGRGNSLQASDGESEIAAFLSSSDPSEGTKITQQDLEAGVVEDRNDSRAESPERDPMDVSMGQWTSPIAEKPRASIMGAESKSATPKAPPAYLQRNSYNRQDSLPTAYGSTYDGRGQTSNVMDGRPPRSRTRSLDSVEVVGKKSPTANITKQPPQQVVFRENWQAKEERLRPKSAFGYLPGWRLLPILVKANDDLRQEQLASQLIQKMAVILARERVPVWLCPYEIIAITDRGGIVEAIPDTISLDSLKRNDPNFVDLKTFFHSYFGDNVDDLADAKSNFVESLAAYSIVTFLLQVKDRHNGNILLDNRGHLIHIDFGFFFLSSPGKNTGFESAPFKLTRDFVEVLGGPESHSFRTFRELCVRSFLVLRRHCMEIILLVEMLKSGNEDLSCFRGRPDDAIKGLRERFRLDLSDRACREYVHSLVDESLENWRTNWYDRYQRYCVGVL